jgi:hypothetical protein
MKITKDECKKMNMKYANLHGLPIKWKPRKSLMIESQHRKTLGFGEEKFYSPYHDEFLAVDFYYSRSSGKLVKKSNPHRYSTLHWGPGEWIDV